MRANHFLLGVGDLRVSKSAAEAPARRRGLDRLRRDAGDVWLGARDDLRQGRQ